MRRVSKKRAVAMRLYMRLRREHLAANPWCVRCGGEAPEIHHAAGRVAGLLTDPDNFRSMCHPCHMYAGEHPTEAYERGWSLRRIGEAS